MKCRINEIYICIIFKCKYSVCSYSTKLTCLVVDRFKTKLFVQSIVVSFLRVQHGTAIGLLFIKVKLLTFVFQPTIICHEEKKKKER